MAKKSEKAADRSKLFCAFCSKSSKDVQSLIAAGATPGVYICGACVGICNELLAGLPTTGFADWTKLSDKDLLGNLPRAQSAHEGSAAVLRQQIDELRKREISWARIGEALGVSRQAAWERFG